jgi:hypothetical protein
VVNVLFRAPAGRSVSATLDPVPSNPIDGLRHRGAYTRGAIMESIPFPVQAMALTFALLVAPVATFAQVPTPTREGNIWGWRDHQPTEAQIQQDEKAAGITPTPSQRDSTSATVDQLYQQLLQRPPG